MSSYEYQKLEPLPRWMRWLGQSSSSDRLFLFSCSYSRRARFWPVEGML